VKYDEIYQPKEWSRDKVNVLLSLDPTKLNYENNPRIHRTDHDFPVAWSKMYGKGRVFYSTLGHTEEAWEDPDIARCTSKLSLGAGHDGRQRRDLASAARRTSFVYIIKALVISNSGTGIDAAL
jgi:type 1 glutamine amidotransferase